MKGQRYRRLEQKPPPAEPLWERTFWVLIFLAAVAIVVWLLWEALRGA